MSRTILHPTDFSAASEVAFAYALRYAVNVQGKLTMLHVEKRRSEDAHWEQYPQVRGTLERWGLLPEGSRREDVQAALGLSIAKVTGFGSIGGVLDDFASEHAPELIILSTHARDGVERWLAPAVAEPLARRTHVPALFVRAGGRHAIDPASGRVSLSSVLVAVAPEPSPHRGVATALALLGEFAEADAALDVHVVHVGAEQDAPRIAAPSDARFRMHAHVRDGSPSEVVPTLAGELGAEVIVVITAGHQGLMDALRGSQSEQIVRRAPCPVLSIPAD